MIDFFVGLGLSRTQAGDLNLFLLMLICSLVLIFLVKKNKVVAFVFSVYVAYFLTRLSYFELTATYIGRITVFLFLAFLLHYALLAPVVSVKLGKGNLLRWLKRIIIALTIVGLMTTIILDWLPTKEVVKLLSPFTLKLFTTKFAKLVWAVLPLLAIALLRKKEN